MHIINFLIPPIMGAVIALFTNWLAIRMLFRPHEEKRIFGIKVPFTPGLIPKERERLTKKLSQAISTRLLTPEVLAQEFADPWMWLLPDITVGELIDDAWTEPVGKKLKLIADNLLPKAIEAVPNFPETYPWLDQKLSELTYKIIDENTGPMAGLFVNKKKIYNSIRAGLIEYFSDENNHEIMRKKIHELIDNLLAQGIVNENIHNFHIRDGLTAILQKEKHALERVLEVFAKYLSENIPVQSMIEKKMASFEIAEAEEIILSVAGRELRVIVLLGGFLGFAIGLLVALL